MRRDRTIIRVDSATTTNAELTGKFDGWDQVITDTVGAWDSATPSRITVPSGYSFARHTMGIDLTRAGNNGLSWETWITKVDSADSGTFPGYLQDEASQLGFVRTGSNRSLTTQSPIVKCNPGDYFETNIRIGGSWFTTVNVLGQYNRSFWEVEWFNQDSVNAAMVFFDSGLGPVIDSTNDWNVRTIVPFNNAAYDTIGATDPSDYTRLTVPDGYPFVRLHGQMRFVDAPPTQTHLVLHIYKNGDSSPVFRNDIFGTQQDSSTSYDSDDFAIAGLGVNLQVNTTSGTGRRLVQVLTPLLRVQSGDYFEMKASANSGVGQGTFTDGSVYLAMEAFESG